QLPPTSYASTLGGDLPLFKNGSTTTYATNVKDVVGSTTRNKWWELDGYSGDTNGTFNNTDLGTATYAAGSFNRYTPGPGYYGETFFIGPPDPRRPLNTGTATSWSTTATFRIKVDSEIMVVTAATGSGNKTWTVQRGQDGTTAATHLLNATVGLATG